MRHGNHTLTSHAQNLVQINILSGISQKFTFYACIILHITTVTKILLPECSIRVLTTQALIYILGECMASWGEPNELSIQHRV